MRAAGHPSPDRTRDTPRERQRCPSRDAPEHQRARIVAEDRPWDAAEMREGGRDALAPIVLALTEKGFHEQPTGVTEDRDEQKDPHPLASNPDTLLAEIDL